MSWVGLLAGFFLGVIVGVGVAGFMHAAGDSDIELELEFVKLERDKLRHEVNQLKRKVLELAAKGVRDSVPVDES